MLDGRMSIMSDIVIADRQKAAWKQAELVRLSEEAWKGSKTGSPSRIGAAVSWLGGKLVGAGRSLESYASKKESCPDLT